MSGTVMAITSFKGGSGKTTLACCLAVYWRLQGMNPILIDADPQKSVLRLAKRKQSLGGVRVIGDCSREVWDRAEQYARVHPVVIVDTPGFESEVSVAGLTRADLVVIPVKASPLDVDRMIDTVRQIVSDPGREKAFKCVLTQNKRNSLIAKHIRTEIEEAGFPLIKAELHNSVCFGEAELYGATPTLRVPSGAAAQNIAAIAEELDVFHAIATAASA